MAKIELAQSGRPENQISKAFERCAELRDEPIRTAVVHGAKDNVRRTVEVLHDIEGTPVGYKLCRMPYNKTEAAGSRRHGFDIVHQVVDRIKQTRFIVRGHVHTLLIREDRLRYV